MWPNVPAVWNRAMSAISEAEEDGADLQELAERFTTKVRGRANDREPKKFTARSTSQTFKGTATQGAASFSIAPNKRRRSQSVKKGHAKVEETPSFKEDPVQVEEEEKVDPVDRRRF